MNRNQFAAALAMGCVLILLGLLPDLLEALTDSIERFRASLSTAFPPTHWRRITRRPASHPRAVAIAGAAVIILSALAFFAP